MASTRSLEPWFRKVADAFIEVLERAGVEVIVTSTRRSLTDQRKLYRDYLAGRSKYPAAAPGKSTHGVGLAFDLQLNPPVYDLAGQLWESFGLTWGGRFSDPIHFDARRR